jgi:hypothetical protein
MFKFISQIGPDNALLLLRTRIQELRDRITRALQAITADLLHGVWDEFDYHVDVCRVTQGANIEGL